MRSNCLIFSIIYKRRNNSANIVCEYPLAELFKGMGFSYNLALYGRYLRREKSLFAGILGLFLPHFYIMHNNKEIAFNPKYGSKFPLWYKGDIEVETKYYLIENND